MDDYYEPKEKGARIVALTRSLVFCRQLTLGSAGRGALLALHPLLEGGFRIADRAAQLDIRRPIAGEATLRQPGHTEIEEACGLLRGEQIRSGRRRMMRRQAARAGTLGGHFEVVLFGRSTGVPPVQLPNKRGNHLPIRGTLRVGHIDKTTSGRRLVLSMLLPEPRFASLQAFAASLGA